MKMRYYYFYEEFLRRSKAAEKGWETRRARAVEREKRLKEERAKAAEADEAAFEAFEKAEEGYFNGFEMVETFHKFYHKNEAIYIGESDDGADVHTSFGTFHAGADGVLCYFFSEKPKKTVRFNRSVYFI